MKKIIAMAVFFFGLTGLAQAGMEDDPILTKVMINSLEQSDEVGDPLVLEAQMWIGKDLNKFWIKTDVEQVDGITEENEVQLLYSRAIAPYWDLQMGIRHDDHEGITQDWAVIGFEGLAPYYFEVDAALFVSDTDQVAFRIEAEYELMLTQRWVLSPEISATVYAKDDVQRGIGSGLANTHTSLKLRYEVKREFAPYIGITWSNKFSGTADLATAEGGETSSSAYVIGIKAWF